MIQVACPFCNNEFEENEYKEEIYNGMKKTHLVPLFLPSLDHHCPKCNAEFILDTDCEDEYDSIIIPIFKNT